jgi:hypothetical protein
VQVRKEALKKNPELLEQLRRDAHEIYDQALIIEENCDELDISQVSQWLRDMNPSDENLPMSWEEAAKWTISWLLDTLEWNREKGSVVVTKENNGPTGPEHVECTSLEQLIRELDEAGENAWRREVPEGLISWMLEGGGQVSDMSDTIDLREMLFDRCEEQLKELGWT